MPLMGAAAEHCRSFAPERIVCLTEETTETLYLLGEQHRIVGISAFAVRPVQALREKPVVSQYIKADLDAIVELRPDLVLAFSDLQADICAELIRRGLAVHCFNHRDVAGILEMIRTLGGLIGEPAKADALVTQLRAHVDEVRAKAAALPLRPRVYFEEWPDPVITGIRWVSELIALAGGEDCFGELSARPLAKDRIVTPDMVINRRPDLYLASWCGKRFSRRQALARPGFADAPFTRENRIVEIPSAIILQPGPACLTDGLDMIHTAISRVALAERSGE